MSPICSVCEEEIDSYEIETDEVEGEESFVCEECKKKQDDDDVIEVELDADTEVRSDDF